MEQLPRDVYMSSYYRRWLGGLETKLVDAGYLGPARSTRGWRGAIDARPARRRRSRARARRHLCGAARGCGRGCRVAVRARPPPRDRDRAPRAAPRALLGRRRVRVRARGADGPHAPAGVRDRQARRRHRPSRATLFPDAHAVGRRARPQHLYTVAFEGGDLWGERRRARDRGARRPLRALPGARMSRRRSTTPPRAWRRSRRCSWRRVSSIPQVVDEVIEHYETSVGPLNGARVVARAWTDPAYRERLLADGTTAIAEFGFGGPEGQMLDRGGEHAAGPQRGRLHALLVLPVAGARPAAALVQVARVPRRGWSPSRERRCARWASTCPTTSASASGTARPRLATWCCPSARRAPTASSAEELAQLVTRDSMIGVGGRSRRGRRCLRPPGSTPTSRARSRRRATTARSSSPHPGSGGCSGSPSRSAARGLRLGGLPPTPDRPHRRGRGAALLGELGGGARGRPGRRGATLARADVDARARTLRARPHGHDHDH